MVDPLSIGNSWVAANNMNNISQFCSRFHRSYLSFLWLFVNFNSIWVREKVKKKKRKKKREDGKNAFLFVILCSVLRSVLRKYDLKKGFHYLFSFFCCSLSFWSCFYYTKRLRFVRCFLLSGHVSVSLSFLFLLEMLVKWSVRAVLGRGRGSLYFFCFFPF